MIRSRKSTASGYAQTRPKCDNDLIRLLSVLLSTEKRADEKKRILETEFNISMTKEINEEVNEMCDYSNYVEKKGIEKGRNETLIKTVESAMQNLNLGLSEACKALNISLEEYQKAKAH